MGAEPEAILNCQQEFPVAGQAGRGSLLWTRFWVQACGFRAGNQAGRPATSR